MDKWDLRTNIKINIAGSSNGRTSGFDPEDSRFES